MLPSFFVQLDNCRQLTMQAGSELGSYMFYNGGAAPALSAYS
jgi:hypothetical protein